ncbi:uncharacterized protein RCO7_03966 [Rhynchosporium graminicola]|uniref:Uncharacterized protein n=1 Tax=Rhynchosporium graminicola TaxID=2792576 RepID=A0A1E1L5U4_9HELO|nr:uncharacterized protein RCO7_03966 [Rhynchosporium commune]
MSQSYFDAPEPELLHLSNLSLFEKELLSRVIQTLRLGVYMSQKRNNTASPLDTTLPGAEECEVFIKSAFSSEMTSDKLFPLRHTGSSMQFIVKNLPVPSSSKPQELSAINIFQLCIWRSFAFGSCDRLTEIKLQESDKEPDFKHLTSTIQKWGRGPVKLPVPAYGQLQIIKAKIPSMLQSFWELSQTIASSLTSKTSAPTFANLHNFLVAKEISSVPRYGLIPWLLVSDFFEYGVCQPPTLRDLAEHITNSKAAGPSKAIKFIADRTGETPPANADDLAKALGAVLRILQTPPEACPTVYKLAEDCKAIQRRELSVVDLEHALCKIARQNSRVMATKKKTVMGGDKVAKDKKRYAREAQGVVRTGDAGVDESEGSRRLGEKGDDKEAGKEGQHDGCDDVEVSTFKKRKRNDDED